MNIRKLRHDERKEALQLVLSVFLQYEAPDYVDEGVMTFKDFIFDEKNLEQLQIYGAFERRKLVGVIATRNNGNHIALFFVEGSRQKKGIGRKLFYEVLKHSTSEIITVNSSPYAVEVYRKLGFYDTDTEQVEEGMRFTPMIYIK